MTAPNHAVTGALIGLTVTNPWIALPLALLSHFVLDMIPHYDPPGETNEAKIHSKQLLYGLIIGSALICLGIVILLFIFKPDQWFQAGVCAFLATSSDLLYIPNFIHVRRGGVDRTESVWFWRFHNGIQRVTGPRLIWVEAAWFISFGAVLVARL